MWGQHTSALGTGLCLPTGRDRGTGPEPGRVPWGPGPEGVRGTHLGAGEHLVEEGGQPGQQDKEGAGGRELGEDGGPAATGTGQVHGPGPWTPGGRRPWETPACPAPRSEPQGRRLAHQTEGFRKSCLQGTLVCLATGRPCARAPKAGISPAGSSLVRTAPRRAVPGAPEGARRPELERTFWILPHPHPGSPARIRAGPSGALSALNVANDHRGELSACFRGPSRSLRPEPAGPCPRPAVRWPRRGPSPPEAVLAARACPAAVTWFAQQVPAHVTHPQQGEAARQVEDALPAVPVQEQGAHGPRHQRPVTMEGSWPRTRR